ncbi:MAG: HAAS signaling domain-containing protein [Flavonifractor plautii]
MNKAEFLAGLRDALAGKLPSGELEDVLSYYEEYFADAGEEHEAEAAEGLGSPPPWRPRCWRGGRGRRPPQLSAERRPRRLWPVVLGICAAALLLLGVGIRLVFLAQRMPDAPAAGERRLVAAGQEPAVVEQDPVSTPPENKLELEPLPRWTSMWALVISAWRRGTAGI